MSKSEALGQSGTPVLGLERSQSPHVMNSRHGRTWIGHEIQAWASSPHRGAASLSMERWEALGALSKAREHILKKALWLLLVGED